MGKKNQKRAGGAKHWVQLEHYLIESLAWRSMSANAKVVYVELKHRYNGRNNGSISLSAREAGDAICSSHHTGARALNELQDHGFIEIAEESDFNRKVHISRSYLLTEARDDRPGQSAISKKTFMRWLPTPGSKFRSQSHRRDATVAPVRRGAERVEAVENLSRMGATVSPYSASEQSHGCDTYRLSTTLPERSDHSYARASAPSSVATATAIAPGAVVASHPMARVSEGEQAAVAPSITPSLAAILKKRKA